MEEPTANIFQWLGAGFFGAVIGWYTYYINRYRTGGFSLTDIGTLIGILGGAAILAIFPARTSLFAAYGIGLGIGFFGYFLVLNIYVAMSKKFTVDWFLDGRRKELEPGEYIPESTRATVTPMGRYAEVIPANAAPSLTPTASSREDEAVPVPPPAPPRDYGN